jgi:hypothetical protein
MFMSANQHRRDCSGHLDRGYQCLQWGATVLVFLLATACGGAGDDVTPPSSTESTPPPSFAEDPQGNADAPLPMVEPGEEGTQRAEPSETTTADGTASEPVSQPDEEGEQPAGGGETEEQQSTSPGPEEPAYEPVAGEPVLLDGRVASTDGGLVGLVGRNIDAKATIDIRRPDDGTIIAQRPIRSMNDVGPAEREVLVELNDCGLARELVATGLRFWIVNPTGAFSQEPVLIRNQVGLHPTSPCNP